MNLTGPYSSGHPAEVIDTTHAMMFAAGREIATRHAQLGPGVYAIPDRVDRLIADRKLQTLGIEIDPPTSAQEAYSEDWQHTDSSF